MLPECGEFVTEYENVLANARERARAASKAASTAPPGDARDVERGAAVVGTRDLSADTTAETLVQEGRAQESKDANEQVAGGETSEVEGDGEEAAAGTGNGRGVVVAEKVRTVIGGWWRR